MQAIAVNQRRERFRDVRVRRAIALCFDFEWTNRSLFYGLYDRSQSCFETSEFKASGTARARRTGAARAAARQAARRSLRRSVSAAKLRRQRTRPEAARRSAQADDRSRVEACRARSSRMKRRDLQRGTPGGRRGLRAHPVALGREHEGDRLRCLASAWSNSAQHQARQADFDFDMISMALLFSPDADARRAWTASSIRNRPTSPARATCRALPTRPSTHSSSDRSGQQTARADGRDARARPGLARTAWTGYQVGIRRIIASPSGTCLASRSRSRTMGLRSRALWWFDEDKAKAIGKG